MALRGLSQDLGFFVESEKGRQQLVLKRTVGEWILKFGYCLYLEGVGTALHPEQGPVWDWRQAHWRKVLERLGANYQGGGPGILRKIPDDALAEIRKIFDATGGTERFRKIEEYSALKAAELNLDPGEGIGSDYFARIYKANNGTHHRE
jgi:heterodisulfide reductase subunit C